LISLATRLGSRAVLNTSLVMGASILSRLVALVVVVRMATYLGPTDYGRYTSMVAYSALVSVLADFGLNTLYTREAARNPEQQPTFLGTLLAGKIPLAVLATLVFSLVLAWSNLGDLAVPAAALLILTTYSSLLRNTFYALGRLEFEAVAILVETAIQAGGIILGARAHAGVAYFVGAYAVAYGFTVCYCLVVIGLFRMGGLRLAVDWRLLRSWLQLAFPFALGSFLTNLYFKADVPILQHTQPFSEVGWYEFAYKPFEALQFVPLAVQSVVYPLLGVYFRGRKDLLGPAYERFFKVLVVLGWPLSVGTCLLTHPIGGIFHLYPQSEPALRILSVAIVLLFANSAFSAMLLATDRQGLFAWTTGIAVVINIGLNLIVIPRFGYLAAASTTVITEAAFSVLGWYFVGREFRLRWFRATWRVLLAGLLMGVVLVPFMHVRSFHLLALGVLCGGLVYLAALWLLRAVSREEMQLLIAGVRRRAQDV
jgi:O-antigen/teichoic acid export membrane protein